MILHSRRRPGFTLFEAIVAIFILLVGVMGIASVFSAGMRARMVAQELITSQELANMWADWIRFRLEAEGLSGGTLSLGDLAEGASGDFYNDRNDSGSLHLTPPGNSMNLPTYQCNAYDGFTWRISSARDFKPEWIPEDGSDPISWDKRLDGNPLFGWAPGPDDLREVELTIRRGSRGYKFAYQFSGVGLKYDGLYP